MAQAEENPRNLVILMDGDGRPPADGSSDFRGKMILDHFGKAIGIVEDLLVDNESGRARFMIVSLEKNVASEQGKAILPVDLIFKVTDHAIHLNYKGERIANAPPVDVNELRAETLGEIYTHYGCVPFWGEGYVYPTFPRATM